MMKLMKLIAAATVAAGAASPVLANDPFVSSQNGEEGAAALTPAGTAGIVAGVLALGAVVSGGDSSSTTTTTTTTTGG